VPALYNCDASRNDRQSLWGAQVKTLQVDSQTAHIVRLRTAARHRRTLSSVQGYDFPTLERKLRLALAVAL